METVQQFDGMMFSRMVCEIKTVLTTPDLLRESSITCYTVQALDMIPIYRHNRTKKI